MSRSLLAFLLLLVVPTWSLASGKNVLLIVADDLGRQVGCYGDKVTKTPHLDSLAGQGTRYANAFASVASCSPSRATILTGLPTHQCGQYGLAHSSHNSYSFAKTEGLPALLKPNGYRSGVIAKLHVQPESVYPFDAVIGDGGRNPVTVTAKAKKFLEETGDKPFFLLVGLTDPHRTGEKGFANDGKFPPSVPALKFDPKTIPLPYFLPDSPEARAEWADYYQSIHRLDHGVGMLMKLLEETKKLDDTLVIFLSDNGPPFPGAKTTLYDAGVQLPLIIRKPGGKAGNVSQALASWTDIVPTILDWTGTKANANSKLPGRSLLPTLETEDGAGWDTVYGSHQFHEVTMYYPMRMVRTRTHKLIHNYAHALEYPFASDLWGSDSWQGILKSQATMMGQRSVKAFVNRPKFELYDLINDPNELKNLAAEPAQKDTLVSLQAKLQDWQKSTSDPWLIKLKHE
ncbi:MAG: sulfatase family protein [Fimbriiglobus sp.]